MAHNYPEPPDTTIVGFGSPVAKVYVRVDEWVIDPSNLARWWEADSLSSKGPLTWEQVTDGRHYGAPYVLLQEPI